MIKQLETKEEMQRTMQMILDAMPSLGGTHDFTDIIQLIMDGMITLWISDNSFILTEVVSYPRMKAVNMFMVGGDLEELLGFDDILTEYGKHHGCSRLEGWARPGFAKNRSMKALGFYKHKAVVYKDIHDGQI